MSARETVRRSSRRGAAFLVGAVVGTGAWWLRADVPLGAQATADEVQDQLDDLEAGSIASLEVEGPSGSRRIVKVRLPR